jgi:hypothetical protein
MLTRALVYLVCAFVALGTAACAQHAPSNRQHGAEPHVTAEQGPGGATPLRAQPRALDIVRDDVDVLSSEEDRKLTAFLQEILDRTGVKVLVVLVPTTEPDPSERYGGRFVEYWAKRGLLDPAQTVIAVLAVDDRDLSVLAGRGLPALRRELAGGGALSFLVPYLKEERYFDAMMALGQWLSGRIRNSGRTGATEEELRTGAPAEFIRRDRRRRGDYGDARTMAAAAAAEPLRRFGRRLLTPDSLVSR